MAEPKTAALPLGDTPPIRAVRLDDVLANLARLVVGFKRFFYLDDCSCFLVGENVDSARFIPRIDFYGTVVEVRQAFFAGQQYF